MPGPGTDFWGFGSGGGGTSDHGALTGLSDDDHPQYLLLSDVLDEDDMASDSATSVPSQQSVKAYTDLTPKSVGLMDRECHFSTTTFYVVPGNKIGSSNVAIATPSANWLVYMPFVVSERMTIEEVAVDVTTAVAGSTFYVGVYSADTEWQPSTLIYGSGSLSGATTGKKSETGLSFVLTPGRYVSCFHPSAGVVVRGFEDAIPWVGPRSTVGGGANVVPYYWRVDRGSHSSLPSSPVAWDTVAYSNGTIKVRQFLLLGVSAYG